MARNQGMLYSIPDDANLSMFFMKKITPIIRRLQTLHTELARLGPVMRGSVVRLGPYKHIIFSLNKDKKTRLVYLGTEREQVARQCSDNYKNMLEIAEEMTMLNMALLKQRVNPVECLKNQKKNRQAEL
jgi:hypothetical protein